MHYQKDAQGNVPKKPDALLAADKAIEKLPLGVSGDADVEIIPVAKHVRVTPPIAKKRSASPTRGMSLNIT